MCFAGDNNNIGRRTAFDVRSGLRFHLSPFIFILRSTLQPSIAFSRGLPLKCHFPVRQSKSHWSRGRTVHKEWIILLYNIQYIIWCMCIYIIYFHVNIIIITSDTRCSIINRTHIIPINILYYNCLKYKILILFITYNVL